MQYAILAGVLASIACGVVGTYIVVRRITYIAGSISHCILGGIGAAVYLRDVHGWTFSTPLRGAVLAAILAALIIGIVSMRAKQREDTVIGAVWAIGMAAGILFIWKTPGYQQDLMSYLFGNILMVTPEDLWLIAGLDVAVIAAGLLFYNPLLALCFDEEFARTRGMRVEFYYLFLLCLTALTVVLLVSVVGIILVIALLTLPVAVSSHLAKRLWQMMVLASIFSILFTVIGQAIAYSPGLPAGATIIVLAGAVYLVVAVGSRLPWRRKARERQFQAEKEVQGSKFQVPSERPRQRR
jgi:zinc transport system permease protein